MTRHSARLCRCGHTDDQHEHYHSGTYCGVAECECEAFRYPGLWDRFIDLLRDGA